MNERRLLFLAAVGASVVAYVVYALLSRSVAAPPEPNPSRAAADAADAADAPPEDPRVATPRKTRPKEAALPSRRPTASRSGGPPPALPVPDISLEEARGDYEDLLAELERELERNKETGKALPNNHWVEYYRRGHEVMTPLRRYLSIGSEEGKTEVADMDQALRDIMGKLQTDPADLEENELEEPPDP